MQSRQVPVTVYLPVGGVPLRGVVIVMRWLVGLALLVGAVAWQEKSRPNGVLLPSARRLDRWWHRTVCDWVESYSDEGWRQFHEPGRW